MRKQPIATMLSECFCFWLLTTKNQFLHTLLIDIVIVGLTVFRLFKGHAVAARPSSSCLCCLFSMLTCFFKTSLALPFLCSSALQASLARVQGFSLMVTTHNSTALKVNGMTEGIFVLVLFGSKDFCIRSPDTIKSMFMPTMLLHPFFHLLTSTNPSILMGAK